MAVMNTRSFGDSSIQISEIGLGAWQLGGDCWGDVPQSDAMDTLGAAVDRGVTFIDTADVYGSGRSETLIGQFLKQRRAENIFVSTKVGRFPQPGWPKNFSFDTFQKHTEASLQRLGVEALDLTQLHSIPIEYYRQGDVFDWLRRLQQQGKVKRFGVSVESMDEALLCLEHDGLASLQIIFNIFRQKPIEVLFEKAQAQGVAIIVRLPLASGLLTGKFTSDTTFPPGDHRHFNCDGQRFNVGETFAGLPFDVGVALADRIKPRVPKGMTMAQLALRWVLDFDAVSVVIPGARNPQQARDNAAASALPSLTTEVHDALKRTYNEHVADHIRGPY